MRYYVVSIQYNKDVQSENRTVPKAYDSYNDAKKEFHRQLATDMGNETLSWSLCMIITSDGNVRNSERWDREFVPEQIVVEETTEEVTEEVTE